MSDMWGIEALHRVYDNDEGACIEFRVCPDFPGNLMIYTPNEASNEYYGAFRISFELEHAKKFKKALELQIQAMESKFNE